MPQPLFTFRGHTSGVTAVTNCKQTLISGDEEGNIIYWSLTTFRRTKTVSIFKSRIQSLNVIKSLILSQPRNLLVCQSRDEGVKLIICDTCSSTEPSCPPTVAHFSTYGSLFSRGDAMTIDDDLTILAFPSSIESYLVAVYFIGHEAKVMLSGIARRDQDLTDKAKATVFDIKVKQSRLKEGAFHVFAGFEDGCISIFNVDPRETKKVPELEITGLNIDVIITIDFDFHDFVSAFDLVHISNGYNLICGSPHKEIIFCTLSSQMIQTDRNKVAIRRQGTSVISIRQDKKLVAIANWDNTIRLYSFKSKTLLATIRYQSKQVHSIEFIEKSDITDCLTPINSDYLMCCASLDGTISVYDIY